MKVVVSVAMSVDGHLDDTSPERLRLSSEQDFMEVYRLRALSDAILVGANTIRLDNPSLITKHEELEKQRRCNGKPKDPLKVTVTRSGNLDVSANFFKLGTNDKLVFCPRDLHAKIEAQLSGKARVISPPTGPVTAKFMTGELERRGCEQLFVEGGTTILSMFFQEGMVNRFRLAISPLFVGQSDAPRLVHDGKYPYNRGNRMQVENVEEWGDTVAITYRLAK